MPDSSCHPAASSVEHKASLYADLAWIIAVAIAYIAAAQAGFALSFATKQVSAVWPPTGIAVAALILRGYKMWPGVFLGAFISNAFANEPLVTAIGIAVGNTLEPLLAAFLLQRVVAINPSLNRIRDVLGLAVLGAGVAMLVTSSNGVVNLLMAQIVPWDAAGSVWWTWWIGDAMGVLIVAPVLLTWFSNWRVEWRGLRLLELFAVMFSAVIGSYIFYSLAIPFAYPVFPIVIWAALRFGQRESATAVLLISIIAVWLTTHSMGPFTQGTLDTRLMHLVAFMSVLGLTAFSLGATAAQRRKAEASLLRERDDRLQESDARFEGAFESAAHGMALVSPQGRWVRVNAALCRMVGYTEAELLATDFQSVTFPKDLNADLENVQSLLNGNTSSYQMEKRYVHKSGEIIWVLLGVSLVRAVDGTPVHFVSQIIDITQRKRTEQFLQLALNGSGDGAWNMDLRTATVTFSRRAREILGVTPDGPPTMQITEIRRRLHPDDVEKTIASRDEHVRGATPQYTNEARVLLPDGSYRWILTRGVVVSRDREGTATRLVGTVTDLTSLRAAEAERAELLQREEGERRLIEFNAQLERQVAERTEQLEDAKLAAEAANAAKSQFLAMMSHELRTPMTGVLGMADLLLAQDPRPDQSELLNRLIRSARTLLDLLNDVLDFAKVEAGRIEMEDTDFSLQQVVKDIESAIAPLVAERANVLHVSIDPAVRPAYRGDAKRYQQILMNLVGNANKFTERGTITINIREERADADGITLRTEVTDTGIGIPRKILERLFKPFVQGDASTSRKFGGTGLGLTISKSLAERMGGSIWVDSTPGTGSTFAFTVRFQKVNAMAAAPAPPAPRGFTALTELPPPVRPLRILHAEDSETIRMMTSAVLSRIGHIMTAVEDGSKAVEEAERKPYDLILMDMQMPVMDGPSAVRAIRAGTGPNRNTPAIALTADVIQENHKAYLAAGTSIVVTKPVDWKVLIAAIDREANPTLVIPDDNIKNVSAPAPDVFDASMMEDLGTNIDPIAFNKLITNFNGSIDTYVSKLVDAIHAGDMTGIARVAHTLKGTAAQFGATLLSQRAREIETASKEGRALAPLVSGLNETAATTRRAIDAWRLERSQPKAPAAADS